VFLSIMLSRSRRVALVAVLLLGLPLAAVVAAFASGAAIDLSRWRGLAEQQASAALGRPVLLQGALRLRLGREPTLHVGGLRVLNAPGFAAPALLSIGQARVGFDLLDVLRGAPRLRRVEADDVALWLERAADGRGNWMAAAPRESGGRWPAIDIGQIALQRVAVHHHDLRTATRRDVDVETLSGGLDADAAVQLSLRARVGAGAPFRLALQGGPLRQLQGGAGSWPFELHFLAPMARLRASGVFDARRGEARFDFEATVDDAVRAGRQLGLELPPIGRVAVRGSAQVRSDGVELNRLQGTLPGADFSGQLALALAGPRPQLTGALRVDDLDLQPWFAAGARARDERAQPEGAAWQAVALRDLLPFDAELDLGVNRGFGLPLDLRDARLTLRADARGLRASMDASVSGASASGRIDLDTAAPMPALTLQLAAEALPLGELARGLGALQGVDGTLGRFGLQLDGRGETLGAWLQDLQGAATMAAVSLSVDRGWADGPLAFELDRLQLLARRGERVQGRGRASWLGERVALSLRTGRLPDMLRGSTRPIELELATAAARLRITTDLAAVQSTRDGALGFDLEARRSGDLARWLGVAPASALPVAARGRLHWSDHAWQLEASTVRLGRSDLAIDAGGSRSEGAAGPTVRVRSALLDVTELMSLLPAGRQGKASPRAATLAAVDADLGLDLQQLMLGRTTLTDVGLVARLRQGRLLPSQFKGRVAGTTFNGVVEVDPRSEPPLARLELATGPVDTGRLLHELGAAEHIIDGRAEALQLSLQGRGRDWREFVAGAELQWQLVGGRIGVRTAAQRPLAEMRLRDASIDAAPGEPLRVRLDGSIDRTPVHVELSSGSLADLLRDSRHLPFTLAAQAAGTRLTLDGEVALPLGRDADLRLHIGGERLESLSELSRVELPPWGPWSIAGPIRMTPAGYEVQGLQVRVGESRLSGYGQLELDGPRPHLRLQVSAPTIQLDDFPLPQRLTDAPQPRSDPAGGLRGTASELAGRTDRLLSARFLRRVDADIDVQAKEVLAGADRLADGALRLRLHEGRLDLDPAIVNLPGGSLRLSISYDLKESELDFAMAADVERFDYGIIARRLRRADDLRGLFSMNMQLQGRAPSLDTIMRNANGQLDIAVWPTELRSGVFNMWSVNLLLTLLPMIDPRAPSQVNCIVGRFDLKDGIVSDDKILIDTTGVRIRGAGQANLQTEELSFVFRPRAKGLALFRLQNPLHVTGTLFDQRIGLDRRDSVESVVRLIASPILWPIERFTLGPLPRDGSDICADPLRAAGR
jgi:uncharacterized protein involved in outer membrane biogenesis